MLLLTGCASRSISIPGYGTYHSNMNSELENLEIHILKNEDGSVKEVVVKLGHSTSDPAITNLSMAAAIEAGISAGLKIAETVK